MLNKLLVNVRFSRDCQDHCHVCQVARLTAAAAAAKVLNNYSSFAKKWIWIEMYEVIEIMHLFFNADINKTCWLNEDNFTTEDIMITASQFIVTNIIWCTESLHLKVEGADIKDKDRSTRVV